MDEENISVKILSENFETAFNGRTHIFNFLDGINLEVGRHKGPTVIYISCICANADKHGRYKTHPNQLVGTKDCNVFDGVCKVKLNEGCNILDLNSIGVKCAQQIDFSDILKARFKRGIDPYKVGLSHIHDNIDVNSFRLCFQVVVEKRLLPPVISNPIELTKRLNICHVSSLISPVQGDKSMIILCDPVEEDDIEVRFYKKVKGVVVWEDFGIFEAEDVHRKCAIKLKSPPFLIDNVVGSVSVNMELYRPSDGTASDPVSFTYKGLSRTKKKVSFKPNI